MRNDASMWKTFKRWLTHRSRPVPIESRPAQKSPDEVLPHMKKWGLAGWMGLTGGRAQSASSTAAAPSAAANKRARRRPRNARVRARETRKGWDQSWR